MPKSQRPRKQRKATVRTAEQLLDHLRRQPPVCKCDFHAAVKDIRNYRNGDWNAWPAMGGRRAPRRRTIKA